MDGSLIQECTEWNEMGLHRTSKRSTQDVHLGEGKTGQGQANSGVREVVACIGMSRDSVRPTQPHRDASNETEKRTAGKAAIRDRKRLIAREAEMEQSLGLVSRSGGFVKAVSVGVAIRRRMYGTQTSIDSQWVLLKQSSSDDDPRVKASREASKMVSGVDRRRKGGKDVKQGRGTLLDW